MISEAIFKVRLQWADHNSTQMALSERLHFWSASYTLWEASTPASKLCESHFWQKLAAAQYMAHKSFDVAATYDNAKDDQALQAGQRAFHKRLKTYGQCWCQPGKDAVQACL